MAISTSSRKLSLEQLEKEVTCGICQEYYKEPKALPCLHYYCKQCILKLALRTGKGKPFFCPECRSEATLPEGGVDELKSAFFMERFKSIYSTMEQAQAKIEMKCGACNSGVAAKSFCHKCDMLICDSCVSAHQTMIAIFKGHEITSIQDVMEGREALVPKKVTSPAVCHIHNEELKVYCFHCNTLICRDCTVVDHRDHRFQFCAVTAPETKEKLLKELEFLRQVGNTLSQAVEKVKSTKQEVQAQGETVAQTINTSFDQLAQILEKRRKELLEEAGRRVQEKVDKLNARGNALSLASAEVQSVVDYTERCVELSTDNEVMSMHTEITKKVGHVILKYEDAARNVELEDIDMGVDIRCDEGLQKLCCTNANITQLPIDLTKCRVNGKGLQTAEVNKLVELTMSAGILINGKPATRQCSVDCYLKSLYNGFAILCEVDQSGPGEYRIQFTPEVRGRHDLIVRVDKKEIADSPIPVFVSIHPTQLGMPVRTLYNLDRVTGIGVNSLGELVVGRQCGSLLTLYKDDEMLHTIDKSTLKISDSIVVGVALDHEDNIYFTLYQSSLLIKTNRYGDMVTNVTSEQKTDNYGLAVAGEEVMVCPGLCKGTIMVYNRDLQYIRKIMGEGMGEFRDVSLDSLGNLFVTDWEMQCIRVFSHDGHQLRSFDFNINFKGLLIKLRGIYVAGEYVYVCAEGGALLDNQVHVFSTAGEYVTAIGTFGMSEGEFVIPYSIYVDRDGFVHVSDNSRVQTF